LLLLILAEIFKEVILDFVTSLLPLKDSLGYVYNAILIIVYRLLKIALYILALKT
jgi:hypothetical protein